MHITEVSSIPLQKLKRLQMWKCFTVQSVAYLGRTCSLGICDSIFPMGYISRMHSPCFSWFDFRALWQDMMMSSAKGRILSAQSRVMSYEETKKAISLSRTNSVNKHAKSIH